MSQRAILGTIFHWIEAKYVAENRSRNHFLVNRVKICRREVFSEPLFIQSKQNLSQRGVLGTIFHSIEAKYVAERCSRNHFSFNQSRICRREVFSEPFFIQSKQNMSQRGVLGTIFHSIEAKYVAESRSRNHFSFNRSKICRREPVSGPLSSQSRQNMSQRAILGTIFRWIEAKYVAENRSRNHFLVNRVKICRREVFSKPLFIESKQNMSQRGVLGTTFYWIEAKYVAENRSRNHFSFNRSKICRRELFSEPLFIESKQNLSQRTVLGTTF
jgi:hypothetical protein